MRPRAASPQPLGCRPRIDDVAVAASTQTGDQGMTLGRTVALLSGLPASVRGYAWTGCALVP